jgi:chromosome segregation ATPase
VGRVNRRYSVKALSWGFRKPREAVEAVLEPRVRDTPRVATEECGSALLTELTQVRAALAQAEARSEERRLALESQIQDVGFMRIQLRVRNARIAELDKEVTVLGGALGRRNEPNGEVKSDAPILTQMRAALAEAEARSEERRLALESHIQDVGFMQIQLRVRNARIAALDKEVSDLRGALPRHNEPIGEVKSDAAVFLSDTIARLTATVAERDASIAALQAMQLAEGETLAARQSELARAVAETEVQRKNLGKLKAALAAANKRLAEEGAAALTALELRNSMEATIGEQRQRVARLEVELAGVVRDRDASVAAAAAMQAEYLEQGARLKTATARVLELEAGALDQVQSIPVLQAEPSVSFERTRDLEGELRAAEESIQRLEANLRAAEDSVQRLEADLHAGEDSVQRLEADLRAKSARLDELAKRHDDSRGTDATHEVIPEGSAPVFIRTGESEVVHVLGRKTTIGRTRENDVQIDAQYISRHHAVILAEPTQTIIEDLNSTNGVIVNGRRVMRQTLKDGDIVLIGKAPFRFAVRPVAEQR